jgi:hypothetical protein
MLLKSAIKNKVVLCLLISILLCSPVYADIFGSSAGTASETTTDTANFNNNLSSADDTVQKALETLDELVTGSGSSTGDVTSVGDCTGGACLDGTSDGGTWVKFYDAQGASQLIGGDTSGVVTITLPNTTGTLIHTELDPRVAVVDGIVKADGSNIGAATAGVDYIATETDPNALLTNGTDNVKDTHIDWGTGAGQVSPADAANEDIGDITITGGAWAVEDDSHAHTSTTISALDISADTNLTAGDALTLTDDDIDFDGGATPAGDLGGTWASPTIDDLFLLNTGDIGTGVYDFGGADSFEIVNGANPTIDAQGEFGIDTTASQLIYSGSNPSEVLVLSNIDYKTAVVENLAAADDNYEIWSTKDTVTVIYGASHCRGTCTTPATITFEDRAGNAMTGTITAASGSNPDTFISITGNNSLEAGDGLAFDVTNTPSPETDEYTLTFGVRKNRQ